MGAAGLALLLGGGSPAAPPASPPTRSWRDGPARLLLTDDEYRRYGRLTQDAARAAFVERFWRRLDPDPGVPGNPYRQRFEALAEEAGRRFREGLLPGWRTDRGRVFLLAGPPASVRRDAGGPSDRDREVWTYTSPDGEGAPLEVAFHRDPWGRFRLRPSTARPPASGESEDEAVRRLTRDLRLGPAFSGIGGRQVAAALVRAERDGHRSLGESVRRTPSPREEEREKVSPGASSSLREDAYFFQAADGSVLALLTLDGTAGADSRAAAWVWDAGLGSWSEGGAWGGIEVPLLPAAGGDAGGDRRRFVGRLHLEPGTYETRFALTDPQGRSVSVRSATVDVPELGTGVFSTSSLVPADRYGPVTEGSASPWAVGSEEVVPRPGGVFHRGEPLRLYLQVYGASFDPATGGSNVDLEFRFRRAGRGRRPIPPLRIRGAVGASLGLALPVGDWLPGDYVARVVLHDRVSGARTSVERAFRIEAQPAS